MTKSPKTVAAKAAAVPAAESDKVISSDLISQVKATADNPLTPSPVAVSNLEALPPVQNLNVDSPTGYPIILNGDHAEFEQEWAGKDPKTRPDWPVPSFDARDWAEAFAAKLGGKMKTKSEIADLALGWMANALMRGFDEAAARASKEFSGIKDDLTKQVQEEKTRIIARAETEKTDLKTELEGQLSSVLEAAKAHGRTAWLKYGAAIVLGIVIGVFFSDTFRDTVSTVIPAVSQ